MPEFFSKWHEIKGQKYIHKKKRFQKRLGSKNQKFDAQLISIKTIYWDFL